MPQLYPEKYAEIAQKLDELEPEINILRSDSARSFIREQIERKKQYGERMFLSPKQVSWIESLHDEYVGTAEPAAPKGIDGESDDMGDDIPF